VADGPIRLNVFTPLLLGIALVLSAAGTLPASARTARMEAKTAFPYSEFCQNESSVCNRLTPGTVPHTLIEHPLRLPRVGARAACPTSRGEVVTTKWFSGVAFGRGPVRLLVAMQNESNLIAGTVDVTASDTPGWEAFKTLWISAPSYQGPFVVHARRIDGSGRIALLDGATSGPLVVPPGPTLNDYARNRTAPQGTYVSGAGCYAFQVDGTSFSHAIVLSAVQSPDP
jgi:hypothetical protein